MRWFGLSKLFHLYYTARTKYTFHEYACWAIIFQNMIQINSLLICFLRPTEIFTTTKGSSFWHYFESVLLFPPWMFGTLSMLPDSCFFLLLLLLPFAIVFFSAKKLKKEKYVNYWSCIFIQFYQDYFTLLFQMPLCFRFSYLVEQIFLIKTNISIPLFISLGITILNLLIHAVHVYFASVFFKPSDFVFKSKADLYDGKFYTFLYIVRMLICATCFFYTYLIDPILKGVVIAVVSVICLIILYIRMTVYNYVSPLGQYIDISPYFVSPFMLIISIFLPKKWYVSFVILVSLYFLFFVLFYLHHSFIVKQSLKAFYPFIIQQKRNSGSAAMLSSSSVNDNGYNYIRRNVNDLNNFDDLSENSLPRFIIGSISSVIRIFASEYSDPEILFKFMEIQKKYSSTNKNSVMIEVIRFLALFPSRRQYCIKELKKMQSNSNFNDFTIFMFKKILKGLTTTKSKEKNRVAIYNLYRSLLVHQHLYWVSRKEKRWFHSLKEALYCSYFFIECKSEFEFLLSLYQFDSNIHYNYAEFLLSSCGDFEGYLKEVSIAEMLKNRYNDEVVIKDSTNNHRIGDPLLHPMSFLNPKILQFCSLEEKIAANQNERRRQKRRRTRNSTDNNDLFDSNSSFSSVNSVSTLSNMGFKNDSNTNISISENMTNNNEFHNNNNINNNSTNFLGNGNKMKNNNQKNKSNPIATFLNEAKKYVPLLAPFHILIPLVMILAVLFSLYPKDIVIRNKTEILFNESNSLLKCFYSAASSLFLPYAAGIAIDASSSSSSLSSKSIFNKYFIATPRNVYATSDSSTASSLSSSSTPPSIGNSPINDDILHFFSSSSTSTYAYYQFLVQNNESQRNTALAIEKKEQISTLFKNEIDNESVITNREVMIENNDNKDNLYPNKNPNQNQIYKSNDMNNQAHTQAQTQTQLNKINIEIEIQKGIQRPSSDQCAPQTAFSFSNTRSTQDMSQYLTNATSIESIFYNIPFNIINFYASFSLISNLTSGMLVFLDRYISETSLNMIKVAELISRLEEGLDNRTILLNKDVRDSISGISKVVDELDMFYESKLDMLSYIYISVGMTIFFLLISYFVALLQTNLIFRNDDLKIDYLCSKERLALFLLQDGKSAWEHFRQFHEASDDNSTDTSCQIGLAQSAGNSACSTQSMFSLNDEGNLLIKSTSFTNNTSAMNLRKPNFDLFKEDNSISNKKNNNDSPKKNVKYLKRRSFDLIKVGNSKIDINRCKRKSTQNVRNSDDSNDSVESIASYSNVSGDSSQNDASSNNALKRNGSNKANIHNETSNKETSKSFDRSIHFNDDENQDNSIEEVEIEIKTGHNNNDDDNIDNENDNKINNESDNNNNKNNNSGNESDYENEVVFIDFQNFDELVNQAIMIADASEKNKCSYFHLIFILIVPFIILCVSMGYFYIPIRVRSDVSIKTTESIRSSYLLASHSFDLLVYSYDALMGRKDKSFNFEERLSDLKHLDLFTKENCYQVDSIVCISVEAVLKKIQETDYTNVKSNANANVNSNVSTNDNASIKANVKSDVNSKINEKGTNVSIIDNSEILSDERNQLATRYLPIIYLFSWNVFVEHFYRDIYSLFYTKLSNGISFMVAVSLLVTPFLVVSIFLTHIIFLSFNSMYHFPEDFLKTFQKPKNNNVKGGNFSKFLDQRKKKKANKTGSFDIDEYKMGNFDDFDYLNNFPINVIIITTISETDEIYSVSDNAKSIINRSWSELISMKMSTTFPVISDDLREFTLNEKKKHVFRYSTEIIGCLTKTILVEEQAPASSPREKSYSNRLIEYIPPYFAKQYGDNDLSLFKYQNSFVFAIRISDELSLQMNDKVVNSANHMAQNYGSINIIHTDGEMIILATISDASPIIVLLFIRDFLADSLNNTKNPKCIFSIFIDFVKELTISVNAVEEPFLEFAPPVDQDDIRFRLFHIAKQSLALTKNAAKKMEKIREIGKKMKVLINFSGDEEDIWRIDINDLNPHLILGE